MDAESFRTLSEEHRKKNFKTIYNKYKEIIDEYYQDIRIEAEKGNFSVEYYFNSHDDGIRPVKNLSPDDYREIIQYFKYKGFNVACRTYEGHQITKISWGAN